MSTRELISRSAWRSTRERAPGAWAPAIAMRLSTAAVPAAAQTWECKSCKKQGMGGPFNKEVFTVGTISIEEKDGKSMFRMNAGSVDACLRGEIPAEVVKTAESTPIEPPIALAGRDKFHYMIRNDGSSGHRETWRNDKRVSSRWDHGLTPKK